MKVKLVLVHLPSLPPSIFLLFYEDVPDAVIVDCDEEGLLVQPLEGLDRCKAQLKEDKYAECILQELDGSRENYYTFYKRQFQKLMCYAE